MPDDGPQPTMLGKLLIFLFIAGCLLGAWWWLGRPGWPGGGSAAPAGGNPAGPPTAADPVPAGGQSGGVTITIAYGSEKKRWLEWAKDEFARSDAGRGIVVDLMSVGSQEGAQRVIDNKQPIHAWAPASSAWESTFRGDFQVRHGSDPIGRREVLALSPMVYVWWKERYQAFLAKYGAGDAKNLAIALTEPTGWAGIANKPDWGLMKFSHTRPDQSNSGLMALALLASEFHGKTRALAQADVLDAGFQKWLAGIESAVTGMEGSTGDMMKAMVQRGPSSYDCVLVYEAVAIDFMAAAQGRWGDLTVVYPRNNVWNDNPFYVIKAPWTSPSQQRAAGVFCDFLLSETAQRKALEHGFRPGNTNVPVLGPDSPFTKYAGNGLRNDLNTVIEVPPAEVITTLLMSWQRLRAGR